MKLHSFSFPLLLSFMPFLYLIVLMVKITMASIGKKLAPGPQRLPLIGNLHQLGRLAHKSLGELAKKYGPLMHIQVGEAFTLVVSSPDTAKEVLHTHDINFADKPFLFVPSLTTYGNMNIINSQYGHHWRQLRKICMMHLLSAKRVQSFRQIREEEVSDLIENISSSGGLPVNLTKKIHLLVYGITARAAFSKSSNDKAIESFMLLMNRIAKMYVDSGLVNAFPSMASILGFSFKRKVEKLFQQVDQILEDIIMEHKERKSAGEAGADNVKSQEDLVDVLLKLQANDLASSLPHDSIKAVILDMFLGGSKTSATTVDWAMLELLKNPKVMHKTQAEVREVFQKEGTVQQIRIHELKLLRLVIKETLRLHPPLPLVLRACREACTINGHDIPIGTTVTINLSAIGRDPKFWIEPERFWPERFIGSSIDYKGMDFEYIPFGSGRRICPGMSYGIANIELLLAQLLYHFDWELPGDLKNEDLDMTEKPGPSVARNENLILIPAPYLYQTIDN